MERKSYTREYKIRAVQLIGDSFKPVRQLAEELGVSEINLYNWRKQLREKAEKAFSNKPRLDEKKWVTPLGDSFDAAAEHFIILV